LGQYCKIMRMLNLNTASVYMPYLMRLSCSFKYDSMIEMQIVFEFVYFLLKIFHLFIV